MGIYYKVYVDQCLIKFEKFHVSIINSTCVEINMVLLCKIIPKLIKNFSMFKLATFDGVVNYLVIYMSL